MSYFREVINSMSGYTPGEQPAEKNIVKLNTNENPFPPPKDLFAAIDEIDLNSLRLYPDPSGVKLRRKIAEKYSLSEENVMLGNGSDDILTIIMRSFAGEGDCIATLTPSYSLYPVLAEIQGCKCIQIPLENDFSLPDNITLKAEGAKFLIFPRPNAPSGNSFKIDKIRYICRELDMPVIIDEAYAEFAEDNCIEVLKEYSNLIIVRTLSKSHSLAGLRLGYALSSSEIISGMMKVKDSYNVNFLTQKLAFAALQNEKYINKNIEKIRKLRRQLSDYLKKAGFKVVNSEANFIFVSPPEKNAEELFKYLKSRNILVRYFSGKFTDNFIRITIGKADELKKLADAVKSFTGTDEQFHVFSADERRTKKGETRMG